MERAGSTDAGPATARRGSGGRAMESLGLAFRILGRRLASPRGAVVAATLASVAVTAVVMLWPAASFTWREPTLRVSIETVATIIALIAAFLIAGEFERRRRLDDLVLAYALGLLALTNFAFGVIPIIARHGGGSGFGRAATFDGRLLATILFATAAFTPSLRVRSRFAQWTIVAVPIGVVGVIAAATALIQARRSTGAAFALGPEARGGQQLTSPLIVGGGVALVVLLVAAGLCYARRSEREHNTLIGWLAMASVFAAFARVNDFLSSPRGSDAIHVADAFRLLFCTTILVAAAREVRSYWSAVAELAVLEERRRIARDLHDGLTQDLAFIGRNLRRLQQRGDLVERLESAGARALGEARRAVDALADPVDRPLDVVLAEVADEVAAREGGRVALSLARGLAATPAERAALVGITSEAITNAMKHGGARLVHVQLKAEGGRLRLRVVDGGRGFDPGAVPPGGFGLTSMRERAEAVGGRLQVRSVPGRGTEVEVIL